MPFSLKGTACIGFIFSQQLGKSSLYQLFSARKREDKGNQGQDNLVRSLMLLNLYRHMLWEKAPIPIGPVIFSE